MGIPAGCLRITLSGVLNTAEIFNTSVWFDGYTLADVDSDTIPAFATDTTFLAFLADAAKLLSSACAYTMMDGYLFTGGSEAAWHGMAAISGPGTGTADNPFATSCVMSLRTANATRSGRGRMYLPAVGAPIGASGLFTGSAASDCVDTLATWLSSVSAGTNHAVVVSQTSTMTNNITSVDADNVPDVQRRRSNKLTTTRHSAPVS